MIIFLNQDGTVYGSVGESVRQGSAKCNKVYVVSPISAGVRLEVAFELPNGLKTSRLLASISPAIDSIDLSEWIPDGSGLVSYWALELPAYVTQYAGNCKAQIFVVDEDNDTIASDSISFTISAGVAPAEVPDDPDNVTEILNAFTAFANEVLYFQGKSPVLDTTGLSSGDVIEYGGTTHDNTYNVDLHKVQSAGVQSGAIPVDFDVTTGSDNESIISVKNKSNTELFSLEIHNAENAKNDEAGHDIQSTYASDLSGFWDTFTSEFILLLKNKLNTQISTVTVSKVKQAVLDTLNHSLTSALHQIKVSDDGMALIGVQSDGTEQEIAVQTLIETVLANYGIDLSSDDFASDIATALASYGSTLSLGGSLAVGGNATIAGNATVTGDLTVQGRTISEDVEYLNVKDRIIALNFGLQNGTTLAGMAILTSQVDSTHYKAFGIMYNPQASLGNSIQGGFGTLVVSTNGSGETTYSFAFDAGQYYPIVLRGSVVNGNLLKWNGSAHIIEDLGKSLADFYYEGKTQGASGEVVSVGLDGKLGLHALADPLVFKYFTPTAVTPKVVDYLGAFSLQFSAFPADLDVCTLTFGTGVAPNGAGFDISFDADNETFTVKEIGTSTILVNARPYSKGSDGSIYCDFDAVDLSAFISFNDSRNFAVSYAVSYNPGPGPFPTDTLKGYVSIRTFAYMQKQEYALIDTKLDKVTTTTSYGQVYAKTAEGNQTMVNIAPNALGSSLIYRDANGRAQIATPSANDDIANKGYVDGFTLGIVDGE